MRAGPQQQYLVLRSSFETLAGSRHSARAPAMTVRRRRRRSGCMVVDGQEFMRRWRLQKAKHLCVSKLSAASSREEQACTLMR